ncbi:MAG: precorrin-2 C(20)-methyltransferase [Candidatus Syntrophonatronum acetioxidans]|uniref:Precorrin-2 C(20)-methyltransferase n=1 Tax=Candidatus Syntrophonatronum acetioxidans TaxID=1795816 RepID=A0A424YJ17_9FIRM|nr:MAG: precorrin-2 C(20)-methyltransferase [Candidatus Syntrophonatronum acetioxidans]
MEGKLYAVGVGPGEPSLLTIKALKALEEARVVAVPKGKAEKKSLALSIIKDYIKDKEVLELVFPMTDNKEVLEEFWEKAAKKVAALLEKGERVVFATLGDPSLYSTFTYLRSYLEKRGNSFPVEVIPGINSFSAAASLLQISLVEGDQNLAVVSAPQNTSRLKNILKIFDTVVILKVHRYLEEIMEVLEELDLEDKGYFVSSCGREDEYFSRDLKALLKKDLDYLSMIIVRK